MKGRTIIHRTLHGAESNGALEMRIRTYHTVYPNNGYEEFLVVLHNPATGHLYARKLGKRAFGSYTLQLASRYRFIWLPMRKYVETGAEVYEEIYYI